MTREEWLKTRWKRYPAAQNGWLDVSAYMRAGSSAPLRPATSARVAGRLTGVSPGWQLEWGGERFAFQLTAAAQAQDPVPYLRVGDLVVVDLEAPSDGASAAQMLAAPMLASAVAIELLAPSSVGASGALSASGDAFDVERSRAWAGYLQAIRDFFVACDFIEVRTPTLVPSPGTEPFLDPFETRWEIGSTKRTFYLPTSPEFHLKQMLARGWSRVFELKSCFRNGEVGPHHQPEFLMLEWYRAFADLDAIADDVDALFRRLGDSLSMPPIPRLKRATMAKLFADHYHGFTLTPQTTAADLRALARAHQIAVPVDESFDDVFARLFLERIESGLGADGPLLVSHYPPSQAALSRVGAHGFAERFEIYWRGLEIANAFHELNDPAENEARFADDAAKKRELEKPAVPRDENLVRALRSGFPPSGGIALGVDRLFMALLNLKTIDETQAFPIKR